MYSEIYIYFQKAIIVICAKGVITFRVSCLLSILSETEENFNVFMIEKNGNSYDWVYHSRAVVQIREDIGKSCNFAKKCLLTNTKISVKSIFCS